MTRRYEQRVSNRCNSIASEISVETVKDTREILDAALTYLNGDADAPSEFKERDLKRIMVNYIRHEKTSYEEGLKGIHRATRFSSPVYSELAYQRYKNRVLFKIAQHYPFLQEECERQKKRVYMTRKVTPQ